jgi:Icc-related predicted phosphoesterase
LHHVCIRARLAHGEETVHRRRAVVAAVGCPGGVMKCLLVSDLHYTLKQLDWLQQQAQHYDTVVIAGDHLDISSAVALEAQIVVTLKYLQRVHGRTRLLVSSGNHDLNAAGAGGEKTAAWMSRVRRLGIATDGDFVDAGAVVFSVCPWWDGPVSREEVGAQLARDAQATGGRPWIWVYHSPPDDSPTSWAGKQHYGDEAVVEWIRRYQPDIVMTGHIHQSPFRNGGSWQDRIGRTWVFNSGRQIGPVPCHVAFDLEARSATWMSLAGTESVAL